ncbi:hypothetical protein SCACP_20830 [Sporomusa carbonis]|uniref:hypothetical protein n=1 Tax=Sporomusa carbonis TaxID=3076075 RepID=UPI003A6EFFDD
MEGLIPLLLMLVLYLVPELLKRRKQPEEYKYPEIPDKPLPPSDISSTDVKIKAIPQETVFEQAPEPKNIWPVIPKAPVVMPSTGNVPKITDSVSPWQGKLSPQMVQNGLIFAEIIQPPRAYRPIWRRSK